MKTSNFKALIAKMDSLEETELGKLKGGISVLASSPTMDEETTNYVCPTNGYCPKKE